MSLAELWGAELTLVHVYDAGPADAASLMSAETIIEANRKAGRETVATLAAALGKPELPTIVQLSRDIPCTVCEVAQEAGADLVVVGTIGRTGVSRFFLGSVAENVARRAHCPVWVERPTEPTVRAVERIMVCTDLSPLSEAGVALAAEVSATLGGSVELVYALEAPYRGLSAEARIDLTDQLRSKLTALAIQHFGHDDAPRVTIVEGANVVDGVTAHAARTSADLVVIATHGRTGLARAFMGSVAERVTRFAPCSVLVARSPV